MAKLRYKPTRSNPFFGNLFCDQEVSISHFLRKLNELVDWNPFTRRLISYYRGKGETGQTQYNPNILLNMLLLSYLWNVPERMVEEMAWL